MPKDAGKGDARDSATRSVQQKELSALFHGSSGQRAAACRRLRWPSVASEEEAALEKETLKALLLQLLAPELRRAALQALQRVPRWDPEVLNRAVRIPPFQKEEDDPSQPKRVIEPWYGALFFVLDDEDVEVRAGALGLLTTVLCHIYGGAKVPEIEGLFQRLSSIASLCLHDGQAVVRRAAVTALVEVMTSRHVALAAAGKDAALPTVLEAFPRDPSAVLQVLSRVRLADGEAVQRAVRWAVAVDYHEEAAVQEVMRHLASELIRVEGQKEPPAKRRKGPKLDQSLEPGTRFLTAWLLQGDDPVAPAGLAVGLAQSRGAPRMDRLETLLQALAASCDITPLRGLEALPTVSRSCESEPRGLRRLRGAWRQLAEELKAWRLGRPGRLLALPKISEQLMASAGAAGRVPGLAALRAASELLLSLEEALGGSAAAALRLHQAVSWLSYGFKRPELGRGLLALRSLSLCFLGVTDLSQLTADERENLDVLLNDPLGSPLFERCDAHHTKLSLPERRSQGQLQLDHVMVEVDSSFQKGLLIQCLGSEKHVLEVPPAVGPRRLLCPLNATLQPLLDVEGCGGSTGVPRDSPLHRRVNLLVLGPPVQRDCAQAAS